MPTTKRILMITTSHAQLGSTGQKTGFWLEELAAPYRELTEAGATVDLASPAGGRPPADPKSEQDPPAAARAFLDDVAAMAKLAATKRLADVTAADYDAFFVVGGHGAMWDLPDDLALKALLASAYSAGRVVAAVCHGPAALVNVTLADGRALVAGKRVAAFTNAEEAAVNLTGVVPFALQSKLEERGARHEAAAPWAPFAVRDGNLVTGQNPASSVAVAREVLAALG